jgi:outer membrane protein OmpA-like peptidoglycan-associated protein
MTDLGYGLRRSLGIALLPLLLAACAPTATVVLLPDQEGRKTALTVQQGEKSVVLDEPYAAAKTGALGPSSYRSTPEEVQALFGTALAVQPGRAKTFTLYFIEGKEEFTAESKEKVEGVFSEIANRPVPDIVVVGHTDTVGTDQLNDALSLRRAEIVRTELVRRGVAVENIQVVSRGKRQLYKQTPDGVAEPLNRRVEIIVR